MGLRIHNEASETPVLIAGRRLQLAVPEAEQDPANADEAERRHQQLVWPPSHDDPQRPAEVATFRAPEHQV